MAVSCMVAGDSLEVTRDGEIFRLPLVVPIDRLSVYLEIPSEMGFWEAHTTIRDTVMNDAARDAVQALEAIDGVDAVEAVRAWLVALGGRLGKALSVSSSGANTEPLLQPISGNDSE